jgi:hypothetical protein
VLYALLNMAHRPEIVCVEIQLEETTGDGSE